ncbi:hypothetical protein B2J88_47415 [Rhodococcus sp. SRB_17]|nr:hypothetical protein [Rhodococcus sp. SRB_17]
MRIGMTQAQPTDFLTFVADKGDFFGGRGLDVELVPALSTTTGAAVISNDLTIGSMIPGALWPAIDQGACVQALGTIIGNTMEIIAQPDVEIQGDPTDPSTTMASLKGKTIGVTSRGSGMESWIGELLVSAGLNPDKDVNFVAVGAAPTAIEAFKAKQVDVLYYSAAMASQLPESYYTPVTDIVGREGNALSDLAQGYISASCNTIEQRPNDVTNYCKAMWDAYDYMAEPANAASLGTWLEELTGIPAGTGLAAWEKMKGAYVPMTITEASWTAQEKFAGNPPPTAPDFESSVYAPCAGGDPR